MATSYASGCGGKGSSWKLQASMRLSTVSTQPISDDVPDQIGCDTGAVKIVRKIREPTYKVHCLRKGKSGGQPKKGSKSAKDEYERRNVERELYRELSRYYKLEVGQKVWARPPLLLKGKYKHHHSTFRRHPLTQTFPVLKEVRGLTALPA